MERDVSSLGPTTARRSSRQMSVLSVSPGTGRRLSLFSVGRHKKPSRPKPHLDEATLRAKQAWAAKGLLIIMRQKVAERRRRAAAVDETGVDLSESNNGPNPINIDIDMERAEDHVKTAQQTMVNGYIISAIPYMPKPVAALCLVLNVILPGTGTMLSGLTVLCCGKSRMTAKEDHYGTTCCVNLMVGMMQLFTVTFMLVGWVWSLVWGIYMIILSGEMQKELKEKHDKELQAKALVAMNNKLRAWTMVKRNI